MAANLGANLDLCPESLNIDELEGSDYLGFDNFSLSTDKGAETIEHTISLENRLRICFGVSDKSLVKKNDKKLKKVLLNKIHLIYGNQEEI